MIRTDRRLLVAPMAIFGVGGVVLLLVFLLYDGSGPVHENLLPELIGFCIEGFFLVGLLTLIQESRERVRRQELWQSLRGSLRGILSNLDIAMLPPNAEPTPTARLERDTSMVPRFMREMQSVQIELPSMLALKRESIEALSLMRDLVPVAAQLSAGHMRWWIAIVDSMRQISTTRSREEFEQHTYRLLENIQEFDRLGY
ncbi:hypothetical protein [Pseudomarimonas arenosa]|uniref:Uncharacterized protein n=1 Tax=Pseudomarimonas arenosa TaxID=2774145 RepID=A0AAW3ZKQ3_9GAMM|nr:hypothetical protein [Pseudomarimonas arenosa]MBD8526713.1 hypothetical protein [Pseudomarimonas arenosa]